MTTRALIVTAITILSFAPAAAFAQSCTQGTCLTQCGSAQQAVGTCTAGDGSQGQCCITPGSGGTSGTQNGGSGGTSGTQTGGTVTLINPLQGGGNLESFLNNILAFVIRIGSIVVILMLVYVGYLFVVARGEPGKISEARSALLWTVVGALILLGAQAISLGIQATVNAISIGN